MPQATWKIGLLHATLAIPGRTDHDEVVVTAEEIAATGLDYLALGHWHSAQTAKTKGVTYAYAGAPEPVAVDQDRAGKVLLVTLDDGAGDHVVKVEERTVGRTTFERRELDAATIESQPALITKLKAQANDKSLDDTERLIARLKMAELPRNGNRTRIRNRCEVTGRPRAYYRKFRLARVMLRELANKGMIPGLTKSSW